jgi:hypothetical protein
MQEHTLKKITSQRSSLGGGGREEGERREREE